MGVLSFPRSSAVVFTDLSLFETDEAKELLGASGLGQCDDDDAVNRALAESPW